MIEGLHMTDIPALVSLERGIFPDPWSINAWESAFARPDFFGFAQWQENTLIAFVCGTTLFEESELLKIAVRKEERGKGIGKRLLTALEAEAKTRGGEKMFLEVREGNIPARKLYESNGFESTRVRQKYYADGENAVEMYKRL